MTSANLFLVALVLVLSGLLAAAGHHIYRKTKDAGRREVIDTINKETLDAKEREAEKYASPTRPLGDNIERLRGLREK